MSKLTNSELVEVVAKIESFKRTCRENGLCQEEQDREIELFFRTELRSVRVIRQKRSGRIMPIYSLLKHQGLIATPTYLIEKEFY